MANFSASSSSSFSLSDNHLLPPPFSHSSSPSSSSGPADDSFEDACSICLEPFSSADPATVTSCKHEYHLQCILDWSQRSKECPICWQLFVLKDPASQELLAAIENERHRKSRNVSSTGLGTYRQDFDFGLDPLYMEYTEMEEHVLQHLATARYFRRREMQRASGLDPSQVLVITSPENARGTPLISISSPDSSHGTSECDSPTSGVQSSVNVQPPPSVPDIPVIRDGPFKPRVLFQQPPPESPRRRNPSEILSFSESIKSKWSAASARYKESISKSTRGIKERLLARNNSVKELSKEVQREMSAGIAGVAKMIERLELASKRSRTSVPASGCPVGTSSVVFKGKGAQESSINLRNGDIAPDLSPDAPPYISGTSPGRLEGLDAQVRLTFP